MPLFIIVIFLGATLVLLGGVHYFLYFSVIHFFVGLTAAAKNWLLAAFILLPVSFVFSTVMVRQFENFTTRAYYFLSGAWLGFLANFVLASAFLWILIAVFKTAHWEFNRTLAALVLFFLAVCFSIYGVYNAFNPKVKNVTVSIPNLPAAWKGKTVVQLSDVHLGSIYRENFLRQIVEKVNSIDPEMVVITGDLFDGMDGSMDTLLRPFNDLKTKRVYFITGNHETYLGLDKAYAALAKTSVTVLRDEVVDLDGLKLVGISYPPSGSESGDEAEVLKKLQPEFSGQPNILLYHSPVNIPLARDLGVNLQLSGHTHKSQIWPLGLITKWIYKGYDYGLRVEGNFSIYTSTGAGTWGPAMRTIYDPEIVAITLE